MRAAHYAHALREMLPSFAGREDTLIKYFVGTVEANGHAYLFGKIVRSFSRVVAKDEKASTIEVVSATEQNEQAIAAMLKKEPYKLALSTGHKKVIRKTDPGIVGGVVVRTGTMRVDGSHKRALLDLYQNMTGNL